MKRRVATSQLFFQNPIFQDPMLEKYYELFVPGKPFQPKLLLGERPGAYPKVEHLLLYSQYYIFFVTYESAQ